MTQRPVTAIVVSYRTGPHLRDGLHALDSDPEVSAIILVDNGNPPEDEAWIAEFSARRPTVSLISPGKNLGFGNAVNLAAREAGGGYLLLVNPDAILKRGSVGTFIEAAQGLRRPWIAGGKIFDTFGHEARGCRRRTLTLWRALTTFAGWNTWTLESRPPPDRPVAMDAVSGALMFTDTESFAALGGFDPAYFLHVEDVDLCRRAWKAGGEVIYCPSAGALHYGSTSDAPSKTVAGYKADSLALYFRKFAANPAEALLARMVAPLLKLVLLAKARD